MKSLNEFLVRCLQGRLLLLSLFMVSLSSNLCAQVGTLNSVQQPNSPDVAALNKYVEVPVSNYSGIPGISIPLYELKTGDFSVPISLSYHASGIKVRDIPGSCGAGWSLFAGGQITRVVRGYPDGDNLTDTTTYKALNEVLGTAGHPFPDVRTMQGVDSEFYPGNSNKTDLEYDIFYFNFMGYTGRFMFNKSGKIMMMVVNNLKAEYSANHFKLTDGNGIVYEFNETETIPYDPQYYTGTWYLTRIVLPYKNESIAFKYKIYDNHKLYRSGYGAESRFEKVRYQNASPPSPPNVNPACTDGFGGVFYDELDQGSTHTLSSIGYKGDTVKFYTDTAARADLYKLKLDSIKAFQGSSAVQWVKFAYGYSNSSPTLTSRKMLLSSVTLNDLPPYTFTYYGSYMGKTMADLYNKGLDFWGFYNGEDTPYTPTGDQISPRIKVRTLPITSENSSYKNADYKYGQIGSLQKMTYPTGGRTEYTYEGNDFAYHMNGSGPLENSSMAIALDSVRTSGSATGSIAGTHSNEITVHQGQTATVDTKLGLSDDITDLSSYNTYIYNGGAGMPATVKLYQYNTATGAFDLLESRTFNPVTVIGHPTTDAAFYAARAGGISSESHSRVLTEGRYRLDAQILGHGFYAGINVTNQFSYRKPGTVYNAGGIRIKQISFISPVNSSSYVKSYDYAYTDKSSGVLESPFANGSASLYWGESRAPQPNLECPGAGYLLPQACSFYYVHHDNTIPLGNAQGGVIGYAKVTERMNDGRKKVMEFTNGQFDNVHDSYNSSGLGNLLIINHVTDDQSGLRGLLKKVHYYNGAGQKIKQEVHLFKNLYSTVALSATPKVDNLYININDLIVDGNACARTTEHNYGVLFASYWIKQQNIEATADSVYTFNGADTLKEVTKYVYNNLAYSNPSKITRINAAGDSTVTNYKYAYHYTISGSSGIPFCQGIKNLQNRNVVAQPVETYVERKDAGGANVRVTQGQLVSFKPAIPVPDTVYSLSNTAGLTDFSPANFTLTTATRDSRYLRRLLFTRYDTYGNVVEQAREGGVKEVLVWGYNRRFIVARVQSSSYPTVMALIDTNILNNPASDVALRTELNKIRMNLGTTNPKAKVTTYTYATLQGMTSVTDPRGDTTYYEYDTYGRLKRKKDPDGMIRENLWYHYQP